MLDVPARLQLLPGEAEAWQALASVRVNQLASAPEHTAQQVNERALEFPYGLRPLEHRRYLVARFGSAVIPALVSYVRPFTSHDARYLEPLTRIDSPLAAAAMVPHAFLDERLWRFEAQSALLAFPRAAAVASRVVHLDKGRITSDERNAPLAEATS